MTPEEMEEQAAYASGLSTEQVHQIRTTRGLSSAAIGELSEEMIPRVMRRLEYSDLAREREAFRLRQSRNEQGIVPPEGLQRALQELDSTRARVRPEARVAGVPAGAQVAPGALLGELAGLDPGHGGWTALGPGNIGGRTRSLVIHPGAPDLIWAGSVGGGVWRTEDGGRSW